MSLLHGFHDRFWGLMSCECSAEEREKGSAGQVGKDCPSPVPDSSQGVPGVMALSDGSGSLGYSAALVIG